MIWILCYFAITVFILYITLHITWKLWTGKLASFTFAENIPWLGAVPYIRLHPRELYKQIFRYFKRYNHLYVMWYAWHPEIVVGRVDYVKSLLRSQTNIKKHNFYYLLQEWLGTGLLTSTGEKWKKRRAALTPSFHFNILQDYMDIYDVHAQNLIKHLHVHSDTSQAIDVQGLVNLATLDVICETSMGVRVHALDSASESEYARAVEKVKVLLIKRMFNPFMHNKYIYRLTSAGKEYFKHLETLHNFTIDVINKKIKKRLDGRSNDDNANTTSKRRVFLDILLDLYDRGEIDVEGIREEVDTFMFEGHDTTASAICWLLYYVGRHSEIQEKIYEEIKTVSTQEDCSLFDKIRLLKYTECVIKETMRINPPVPGFGRVLTEDIEGEGKTIPAGTDVAVSILSLHHNQEYWENPTVFDPSRFESEKFLERDPYSYIPFSAGPRNCIGQKFAMLEEKVFVYRILSKYRIKSTQSTDEVQPGFQFVTTSCNGINIEFYKREE